MKTFKEFYNIHCNFKLVSESGLYDSDLNFIKKWREKVRVLAASGSSAVLHTRSPQYKKLQKHVMSQSDIAFKKLLRFHFLEYKLHLLRQTNDTGNLIDFTIYEINKLYEWLKEWMLGILETRIYDGTDSDENPLSVDLDEWDKEIQKLKIPERERHIGSGVGGEEMGVPWDSILESYARLQKASTLEDKIIAVTLALNAWHDAGGIFGITSRDAADPRMGNSNGNEIVWTFAPLSMAQFDKLDKIDPRKVKQEIRRDLS